MMGKQERNEVRLDKRGMQERMRRGKHRWERKTENKKEMKEGNRSVPG